MRQSIYALVFLVSTGGLMAGQSGAERPNDPLPRSSPSTSQPSTKSAEGQPGKEGSGASQEASDDLPTGESQSLPRSDSESSSRDNIIDLSPPKDDAKTHPEAGLYPEDDSGVNEFKPWDPHKAQKDIEVGDYYAKKKNYSAAASRYREALEYKPKDALATFKLAEALEKTSAFDEAKQNYESYLQIVPRGPLAEQARKGIERLKGNSNNTGTQSSVGKKP